MSFGLREVVLHPFGKGNLSSNGSQYSAVVTNATTGYTAVQTATIDMPGLNKILEIEFGLTAATLGASTGFTKALKWQASDDAVTWVDVCTAQAVTASTSYQDTTVSGRFDVTTAGFLGKGKGNKSPFYVRAVSARSSATTGTVSSKVKNSSYLKIIYTGF